MINKLAIFGVGLIGGSLALALRKQNYCGEIVGCSRKADHLQKALDRNVIDRFTLDPAQAVKGCDMVVIATPLRAMGTIFQSIRGHLAPGTVLTDAGSSKAGVVAAAKAAFGELPEYFVPGHPIAGREKSGIEAAVINLYENHKVILTPLPTTSPVAIEKVSKMWSTAGAQVQTLGVEQHDLVLAATSHLPHVVAYSLVDTISRTDFVDEIFQFAAGGFRDSSRTASSDPVMWRDICLENKEAILDCVSAFQNNLAGLKELIEKEDGERLFAFFQNAKQIRDANVMKASPQPEQSTSSNPIP